MVAVDGLYQSAQLRFRVSDNQRVSRLQILLFDRHSLRVGLQRCRYQQPGLCRGRKHTRVDDNPGRHVHQRQVPILPFQQVAVGFFHYRRESLSA